jgi:dihydroflavonol-4-reductase
MVLVTGASGFLGTHLVRHLSAGGGRIRALYNNHPPADDLKHLAGVEWMRCDMLDVVSVEEAMMDIREIYHCAAIVSFHPAMRAEILHFNTESTANIINQALLQDVRKLVHISSVAALGRTGDQEKVITEEEEWGESKYNSVYGISKYLAEMEVWRGIGEGLNAVVVNPGIILGCGSSGDLSAKLMGIVYREFPFYPKGTNAWVDVQDVVRASEMLMRSGANSGRFILSGGNFTYREVFTMMAEALNRKPPRYYAAPWMTGIAWRLSMLKSALAGSEQLITKETARNSNAICHYSNEKLVAEFPEFSYTPIKQTVNLMAQSFLKNKRK